jgi:hypothetical protein
MPVMLKWAVLLTRRAYSKGNPTLALLLDDMGIIIDCIVGWLFKWTYSVQKAMLVPLSLPLVAVDY